MNSETARSISILQYLEKKGIIPDSTIRGVAKYKSPLRDELKPSFHLNLSKNVWYDFGIGQGGSIIDLCMLIESVDFKTALNVLKNLNLQYVNVSNQNLENKLIIKQVKTIHHTALTKYLENRKIPIKIAKKYLKEVSFQIGESHNFALGFKNQKDGYELRSKYFKGSSSPKYYTFIKGSNSNTINIFEGHFDFLSALTYYDLLSPNNDTIVLNSLTFIKDIHLFLVKYKRINAYLDNDNAGKNAFVELDKKYKIQNRSVELYPTFKDFNDFIKGE
jgi:DNA primase